jgi:hypothetical protein
MKGNVGLKALSLTDCNVLQLKFLCTAGSAGINFWTIAKDETKEL